MNLPACTYFTSISSYALLQDIQVLASPAKIPAPTVFTFSNLPGTPSSTTPSKGLMRRTSIFPLGTIPRLGNPFKCGSHSLNRPIPASHQTKESDPNGFFSATRRTNSFFSYQIAYNSGECSVSLSRCAVCSQICAPSF